jgi:hypothetical protein
MPDVGGDADDEHHPRLVRIFLNQYKLRDEDVAGSTSTRPAHQ